MREQTPAAEGGDDRPTLPHAPSMEAPERVGLYRVLGLLGRGGMGDVYRAEQTEPVRREVALKLVKPGLDTREVLARFESERQALALMSHPGIAAVLDAGATTEGRPWFAMELIDGQPITDYCDRHTLTIGERLELFCRTCDAVQHAHEKGVVHRDLKPSNVLVTDVDGRPQPKVIDFGVAKAMDRRLTSSSLQTEQGVLLGTPEYMSPEQADFASLDVDTRSDVYSLGVLLHELLTGALPFPPEELRGRGAEQVRRLLIERKPRRPSTLVGPDGANEAAERARRRDSEPTSLRRRLRGDLDWIVLKALEKDRVDRYASPSELAADVQRHLSDELITAGPPSTGVVVAKFVRRHRFAVATVGVVLAALVLGLAGTTVGFLRSKRSEAKALREAAAATEAWDFLVDLLAASDPAVAQGREITAREVLETGAERVKSGLDDQPALQGRLLQAFGRVHAALGHGDQALALLEEAAGRQLTLLGPDDPATLTTQGALAELLSDLGRYDEAAALATATWDRRRAILGGDHADSLSSAELIGRLHLALGRLDEANTVLEATLASRERLLGPAHASTLDSLDALAALRHEQHRYVDAEAHALRAWEGRRALLGDEHPATIASQRRVADAVVRLGRWDQAESLLRDVLRRTATVQGETHLATWDARNELAEAFDLAGRHDEAEAEYLAVIDGTAEHLDPSHPLRLRAMVSLAALYFRDQRYSDAEPLLIEAHSGQERVLGEGHWETVDTLGLLGEVYWKSECWERCESVYRRRLALVLRQFPVEDVRARGALSRLEWLARARGDEEAAERAYQQQLALLIEAVGAEHRSVPRLRAEHALQLGLRDEALDWLREAVRLGWADANDLATDAGFAELAGDPRFKVLVEGLQLSGRIEAGTR